MDKQNKTILQSTIDELTEKLVEYNTQKESLENKISFLETKEVSSTKKLYKSYKANDVNITYNDTKTLIKQHKFLFQVSLNELTEKINNCSRELNENKSHLVFLDFLDEECAKDVEQKKKVSAKKAAKKAKQKNSLDSQFAPLLSAELLEKASPGIQKLQEQLFQDDQEAKDNYKMIRKHKLYKKFDAKKFNKLFDKQEKKIEEKTIFGVIEDINDEWDNVNLSGFIIDELSNKGTKISGLIKCNDDDNDIVDNKKIIKEIKSMGQKVTAETIEHYKTFKKIQEQNTEEYTVNAYNSDENEEGLSDMYEPISSKVNLKHQNNHPESFYHLNRD